MAMLENLPNLPVQLSDDALLDLFNQYNGDQQGAPHMVQAYLQAFAYFRCIALNENDFGYEFYALGEMYETGLGVPLDLEKAKNLYTEAIKRYQTYEGDSKKHTEAMQILEKWL